MENTDDRSDVYEKNMGILYTRYPDLYRIIMENKANTVKVKAYRTKTGLPGIETVSGGKTVSLNSKIDPVREARRIADSVMEGSEQVIVLIGFGLGYHVEEMLKLNDYIRFIVIEPERHIFAQALKARDLRFTLNSDRVMLFVEPEAVPYDALIPDIPAKVMKLYTHRPYTLLFPEKTEKLKHAFLEFRNKTDINTATLNKFDQLWTRNTFKNCEYFFTLNGINILRDSLKGFGALVLAAGPSLDDDINGIRRLQEDVFIIASDSVLRPLLRHGIVPDFVVTVDPQFINSFHVAGPLVDTNKDDRPILVTDPAVHPSALRNYKGTIIITSSVFSPGRIIEEFSGTKGHIAAGGSVATAAFDFARTTGADPIIVAGLDLSYPKGKTHLSGSFIEDYIISKANRFKTVGSFYTEYIRSGKPTTVADRRGRTVFTDKRLLLYKSWFENQSFSNDRTVLNATGGGLSIRGIQDVEFKTIHGFISNGPESKQDRKKAINAMLKPPGISHEGISRFAAYLHMAKKNLHTLQNLAREASFVATCILKKNIGTQVGDEKLASLEAGILSFREENRLISMVLQSPIHEIIGGETVNNRREGLKNSITLYSAMNKAAGMLIDLISLAEVKIAGYIH